MVKVLLRNGWWAPNGTLYRKSDTRKGPPVDIPADVVFDAEGKSRLPSTAEIVDDDYKTPPPKRVSVETFSEHRGMMVSGDPNRAAMISQGQAQERAEQALAEKAVKHQADLAAEKADKPAKKGKK